MHHCLAIQEIVRIIMGFCESEDNLYTLIALARTCRAFEDPALDRIWYSMKSLRPLFKCLPEDSWEENLISEGNDQQAGDTRMVRGCVFSLCYNINAFSIF